MKSKHACEIVRINMSIAEKWNAQIKWRKCENPIFKMSRQNIFRRRIFHSLCEFHKKIVFIYWFRVILPSFDLSFFRLPQATHNSRHLNYGYVCPWTNNKNTHRTCAIPSNWTIFPFHALLGWADMHVYVAGCVRWAHAILMEFPL